MAFDFKKTQKKLREHLAKAFLFVIRDENTFEEIATYRLTFLNVYILLSTVFCIAGLLTFLLITLTPSETSYRDTVISASAASTSS